MGGTRSVAIDGVLSRHQRERERGGLALSVLPLPPEDAAATVGGWALDNGASFALVDATADLDDALRAVVDAIPVWRLLQAARHRLASAWGRSVESIDAAFVARSARERTEWIAELADGRRDIVVAGTALASFAATGVVDPGALGAIDDMAPSLVDLGGPVATLIVSPEGTGVGRGARTAAALCSALPRQPIAIAALPEDLDRWLDGAGSTAAASLVRQGRILRAPEAAAAVARPRRDTIKAPGKVPIPRRRGNAVDGDLPEHREMRKPGDTPMRTRAARRLASITSAPLSETADAAHRLRDALERDHRTRGHFRLDAVLPAMGSARHDDVLYDADLAIAVEIEGQGHVSDLDRYRRDRHRDQMLQRSRVFVVHVLEPDVRHRIEYLVDQIADAMAFRRTLCALPSPDRRNRL